MALLAVALAGACADESSTGLPQQLLGCAFGEGLELPPGGRFSADGTHTFCVSAPEGGSFALVPFVASARDTLLKVGLVVEGGGFASPRNVMGADLTVGFAREGAQVSDAPLLPLYQAREATRWGSEQFHAELRARERELLKGSPGGGGATASPTTASSSSRLTGSSRTAAGAGGPSVPVVGELMQLGVSASCDDPDPRTGRVMAVSDHAVVVEDLQNPQPSFQQADFQEYAQEFDALIHPTVTGLFGQPSDIDGNGRTVLFFTRGVNEKSLFRGTGVVAGFFWGGDLFPRVSQGRLTGCPASNLGEVLYLAVPEPNGEVSGNRLSVEFIRQVTLSTIGHELQHLSNASRRIHVNQANTFEESWLNEGLSFIAEEALFFAASGLEPGMNLDTLAIRSSPSTRAAFQQFAVDNLGRYNLFIQAPQASSPMATDRLTTRGAAWSYLRYVADRSPISDEVLFGTIANSTSAGLDNLEVALGADPLAWMNDWAISVIGDDEPAAFPNELQQPSWNTRELIRSLRIDALFPLRLLTVESGGGFDLTLQPAGASAFVVFELEPGGRALLRVTPGDQATVRSTMLRLR